VKEIFGEFDESFVWRDFEKLIIVDKVLVEVRKFEGK